jgi:5,10-methylenetetrahydromethanopterin reductase
MKRYCTVATDGGLGKIEQMQIGLMMLGDASVQAMVERALLAEAVGYCTVWLADARFYRDVYSCLTHVAAQTSKILLGPCVTD